MCEAEGKDLYAVLGASSSDSAQQLRHRYQQLVLQVNTVSQQKTKAAVGGLSALFLQQTGAANSQQSDSTVFC